MGNKERTINKEEFVRFLKGRWRVVNIFVRPIEVSGSFHLVCKILLRAIDSPKYLCLTDRNDDLFGGLAEGDVVVVKLKGTVRRSFSIKSRVGVLEGVELPFEDFVINFPTPTLLDL